MDGTQPIGRNALVLGPLPRQARTNTRHELLESTDSNRLNVVEVAYTRSPEAIVEDWRERLDGHPRRLFVIRLDHGGDPEESLTRHEPGVVFQSVSPSNLTELGIRVQRCLELYARAEGRILFNFDSLTSMLQFVDLRRAYRYLHMATGQLQNMGADAEFYLDPNAHEERVCHVLQTTFDELRQPNFTRSHVRGAQVGRAGPTAGTVPPTTSRTGDPAFASPVVPAETDGGTVRSGATRGRRNHSTRSHTR